MYICIHVCVYIRPTSVSCGGLATARSRRSGPRRCASRSWRRCWRPLYVYTVISLFLYICIYIYIEREREICTLCVCVYIYIYIHVSQPSRSRVSPRPGRGGSPEEGEPEEGQLECQEGGRGAKVFISRWSFQHRLDCSARDVLGAKLGEPATRSPRSDFRATCCPDPPLDGLGFRV